MPRKTTQKLPEIEQGSFKWNIRPKKALDRGERLKIIVKGLAEGKNLDDIAYRCGVTRKTLYTDRCSVDTALLAQELVDQQLRDISRLASTLEKTSINNAMHFRDKLLGKLIPRKIVSEGQVKGEVEVKGNVIDPKELARYIGVLVESALGQEAREPDSDPL